MVKIELLEELWQHIHDTAPDSMYMRDWVTGEDAPRGLLGCATEIFSRRGLVKRARYGAHIFINVITDSAAQNFFGLTKEEGSYLCFTLGGRTPTDIALARLTNIIEFYKGEEL